MLLCAIHDLDLDIQMLFITMKLILIATTLMLCSLHTSDALDIEGLKKRYPSIKGEGKEFKLPDNFWDDKCNSQTFTNSEAYGDYCFIVQTSCRESEDRRAEVLKSVKNDILKIIKKADLSTFSLVTYSKDAKVELSWSSDVGKIGNILKNRQGTCDDCKAATHKALDACNELFKNKGKDETPDNIIIFTDGISIDNKYNMDNSRAATNNKAFQIQNQNLISSIQVIKIHPTDSPVERTGDDEWNTMPFINSPSTFPANTVLLKNLGVKNDQSIKLVLGEKRIPLKDTVSELPCCTADVVLVLDRSNSITETDLKLYGGFIEDFLEAQKILEPNADDRTEKLQIALITYARRVEIHAHLGEYGKADLIKFAKKISRSETEAYTHTHDALETAQIEFFNSSKARENVRKIAIVFTDGRTWKASTWKVYEGDDTINAARVLKGIKGAEVYVVGLPNHHGHTDGYEREWKDMGSEPISCTVVDMQKPGASFKDLKWIGVHLTEEICNKKKSC